MAEFEKNYKLTVYNAMTQKNEETEVSEAVYNTYRRTGWNIKDNNRSFYAHEIQMSGLIGGEDGAYENFKEFVDTEHTPEVGTLKKEEIELLHQAICALTDSERELVFAIYFNGMTMREYAQQHNLPLTTAQDRKIRILKKIKNF